MQNMLYLANEYLYTICTICALGFTNYNVTPETRFIIGWVYLILLGLILLPNVVVMLYDIAKGIINYFKKRSENKKVEAEKKANLEQAKIQAREAEIWGQNDAGLELESWWNRVPRTKPSIIAHLQDIQEESESDKSLSSRRLRINGAAHNEGMNAEVSESEEMSSSSE